MTPVHRSLSCVLLLLAACGGSDGAAGDRATAPLDPAVSDSAGVTIYEHPGDALERAPRITIDSAPLAVFAGDVNDPDRDVSTLAGFRFTAAGELVGIDRNPGNLVVLDPDDGSQRRFGRQGSGPLELGSINSVVVVPGDTILLTDGANARALLATASNGPIRTESFAESQGMRGSQVLGQTSSGALMARRIGFSFDQTQAQGSGFKRRPILLGIWRPGQDSLSGGFTIPGPLMNEQVSDQGGGRVAVQLIMVQLSTAPEFAAVGDDFVVARSESWSLERWDTTGTLRALIRVNRPRELVTPAIWERHVDSYIRQMLGREPEVSDTAGTRDKFLAQQHADTLPAYGRIATSPNGTIWVPDYGIYGEPGWAATAITADGRILGRIVADSGDAPIAWGDDRAAFRSEDDLGIATITVKRLIMPR